MTITADKLRQLVFDELESLGFSFDEKGILSPPKSDKEAIRLLHNTAREIKLKEGQGWIKENFQATIIISQMVKIFILTTLNLFLC